MDVKLPKLGEGAESGVVVSILVKEGDAISEGQTLVELENEKAVAPIPSPVSGTVSGIRVKNGDRISVGQVILTVGESDAPPPAKGAKPVATPANTRAAQPEVNAPAASDQPDLEPGADTPEPAASPEIRRMAKQLGLDLRRIRGTERGGRIVLADLRLFIERLQRQAQPENRKPASATPTPAAVESIDFSKWGPVTREAMSPLRKTIAQRMRDNWNAIPHVTQFDEADITDLMELRKRFAPPYEAKGARLTLTSFALKAVALALKKHPIFNSSLDEATSEIVLKQYVHIGLAVDTEQGLIVPVIRDVPGKNLFQLSQEVAGVAEKARQRKLTLEEMKGGTFTISNQGGIGGAHFTPIINRPEVAILGLGQGVRKAVVREKQIEPRWMLPLGLSYDHRVIDGASAARFTVELRQAFESFSEADLKL